MTHAQASRISMVRSEFPALHQTVNGRPLAYLDNAATTQKPVAVLNAMDAYYRQDNANVHRGVHALSQRASALFEESRGRLARFIGATSPDCVLWTKGCTESINLVASSWGGANLKPGDRILLSAMEHHANIVPWQMIAERTGATVEPIPMDDHGTLLLDELDRMLDERVKLVGVKQVCNALGTINPVTEIAAMAHRFGAKIMVDGAQGLAHQRMPVGEIDFFAMSAHKTYGPTGVGALYVRPEILNTMAPWQGGGDMIRTVSWEGTTYNTPPNRFEPGTPNIAGVIGFGAAIEWLEGLDWDEVEAREGALLEYGTRLLEQISGVRLVGTSPRKTAILSFTVEGIHPHDLGTILDGEGVAVRTGHHCCMPLMKRLGLPATARASLAIYSTEAEIDQLSAAIHRAKEIFGA